MHCPPSREFVVSFLTVCFDEGLSKEAAAELLQRETVDQELADRPAFASGYLAVTNAVPGQMRPLRAGFEKRAAAPPPGVMQSLGYLGRALFGKGQTAVKGVGTGVRKVRDSPFLQKHPFASALGASAVTGAGVLGAKSWMDRDKSLMPHRPTPFFSPSGYSPTAYKDRYESELESYTPGIYSHNKDYFGTAHRRKELETAIAEGKGGEDAYLELQRLNRDRASDQSARTRHLDSLEGYQAENRELVDRIAARTQQLENRRESWWGAPERAWLSITGRDPQAYYDQKIGELQGSRTKAQMEADLAADRQRLLWAGTTEKQTAKQPTPQEIQQRFFQQF
jgi:hypothetical protein